MKSLRICCIFLAKAPDDVLDTPLHIVEPKLKTKSGESEKENGSTVDIHGNHRILSDRVAN